MDLHQFAADIDANGDVTLLGRITAADASGPVSPADPKEGKLLTQADLASVTLYLYDRGVSDTVPVAGFPINLTISQVFFNVIQTSDIWLRLGAFGGNFKYTIPAANFPTQYDTYRARVLFTTTGGGKNWGSWTLRSK